MVFSFTPRAPGCNVPRRLVACPAQKEHAALQSKHAAVAVALTMSVAVGPMVSPPAVHADSYSDRMAAMEQRKKLLQEARENAVGESSPAKTGQDYLESMKSALSMKIPELPATAEALADSVPEPAPPAPAPTPYRSFNFSKPVESPAPEGPTEPASPSPPAFKPFSWSRPVPAEPTPSPKPAEDDVIEAPKPFSFSRPAEQPTEPAPAPKPFSFSRPAPPTPAPEAPPAAKPFSFTPPAPKPAEPVPAPKPVQVESKKVEEPKIAEQSKKRKGPLPMALAQILLLAAYGGSMYVFLGKSEEFGKLTDSATQAAVGLYRQVNPKKEEAAVSK